MEAGFGPGSVGQKPPLGVAPGLGPLGPIPDFEILKHIEIVIIRRHQRVDRLVGVFMAHVGLGLLIMRGTAMGLLRVPEAFPAARRQLLGRQMAQVSAICSAAASASGPGIITAGSSATNAPHHWPPSIPMGMDAGTARFAS